MMLRSGCDDCGTGRILIDPVRGMRTNFVMIYSNERIYSGTRREMLRKLALAGAAGLAPGLMGEETATLPFENGERPLVKFPQKRPLMMITRRPPQLETPMEVFNEGVITPNDAFFVRYHLANIPLKIDDATFRCEIKGSVKTPLSLSVEDLKKNYEQVEVTAVCQCSGNGRGFPARAWTSPSAQV